MCSGFSYLAGRKLGGSVNSIINPLWFGASNVAANFFVMAIIKDPLTSSPITSLGLALISATGLFAWLANEFVAKGLATEKAGRAASFNYLQVVMAWIFDITVFHGKVKWTDLLGTFCIVAFTFLGSVVDGFCIKDKK